MQPLLVRPLHDGSYELIAGERRWRAAQQAGLEKVPAIVRDSEHAERLQVALIENMVREDLNPVEEARACAALVEDLGLSKEDLARRIGRSRPAVSNLIRLLDLPDEATRPARVGRAQRGPRPRPARRLRQRRPPPPRPRCGEGPAGRSARPRTGLSWLASQNRGKDSPRRSSAEEAAAMRDAADKLEVALGHEVKVRPRGGEVAVEIRLADLDEALALARKLGRKRA